MSDLTMFKKLSAEEQIAEIEKFISTFPESEQPKLRKELIG